ncbi:hypothetical protein [Geobacillus subterraneus]|uniref:hypothetical protein n=1 Tax=Geobacillus subterraneus TaxID=129338 RepID=UPI001442A507|nr:hypothetical protein [Geobacillus subterraneus]QIZ66028.1 hypothetical protein HF500_01085 [Geobacillus subterraneus]
MMRSISAYDEQGKQVATSYNIREEPKGTQRMLEWIGHWMKALEEGNEKATGNGLNSAKRQQNNA